MKNLGVFKTSVLQDFMALLAMAEASGGTDYRFLRERILNHIHSAGGATLVKSSTKHRKPDNVTKCAQCGYGAIIIPVNADRANIVAGGFTHAIQCQNRPADGLPWLPKMCGHTEYIVRGDK